MSRHLSHIKHLASLTLEEVKVEVAQTHQYQLKSYQIEDLRESTHYFPRNDKTVNICRIFINDTDSLGLKNVGWIVTDQITRCMCCSHGFSLKKTRHHCRACGNLVCNKCSNYENPLIGYEHLGPQKVCKSCYQQESPSSLKFNRNEGTSILYSIIRTSSCSSDGSKTGGKRKEIDFPRVGVRLSYFIEFIRKLPTKDLNTATAFEVCEKVIKPLTVQNQSSFCEYLTYTDPSVIGPAAVFISYSWKSKIKDVVEALEEYFQNEPTIFIWIDLFSYNQHQLVERHLDWWSCVLKNGISLIGKTVLVLSPWEDPIPLTRSWCLWELFCTIETKTQFGIAMNEKSMEMLLQDIDDNASDVIAKIKSTIDCEKSESSNPLDNMQIKNAIQRTVGFIVFNKKINDRMKEWILAKYSQEYERRLIGLGADHPQTTEAMENLATLYVLRGNYDKAEPLTKSCLEKRKAVFGDNHPNTLASMDSLAALYAKQGKYEDAEKLYLETVDLYKSAYGGSDENTLHICNDLASVYMKMGKFDLAEVIYKESLATRLQSLGENHPSTIGSMTSLGLLYTAQGKYIDAEKILLECSGRYQELLGENHPETLSLMNNLGVVYRSMKKYDKALPVFQECLNQQTEILGEDNEDTLTTMTNLAIVYEKIGVSAKAEELYLKAYLNCKASLGLQHNLTLQIMHNSAKLYAKQGIYHESEAFFDACYNLRKEKSANCDDLESIAILQDYADMFIKQEKYEKAEPLYHDLLEAHKRIYGLDHSTTLSTTIKLAEVCEKMEKSTSAESLYSEAIEKIESVQGVNCEDAISLKVTLGMLHESQGNYEAAEEIYCKCFDQRCKLLGSDHLDTIALKEKLGELSRKQENYDQASLFLLQCFEQLKLTFGMNHVRTLQVMFKIAVLYKEMGMQNQAQPLYLECIQRSTTLLGPDHSITKSFIEQYSRN